MGATSNCAFVLEGEETLASLLWNFSLIANSRSAAGQQVHSLIRLLNNRDLKRDKNRGCTYRAQFVWQNGR